MHCRARTAAAQFRRQIFLKMKQKVSNKAHVCDIHYFQLTGQRREDIVSWNNEAAVYEDDDNKSTISNRCCETRSYIDYDAFR